MAAPMGFLSEVVGKVAFVNRWPLLLKATQDDDIPTPGYLYKDIADLTYDSSNSCQCLVDFLVERLDKNSCHVKFKCLKIMLHLVEKGHEAFSAALRRKAHGIQAATKYSGPPHALHGMAPYVAVRKIAKELSEKLFDTECETRRGSSGHAGKKPGTIETTDGSRRLEGFGNMPITSQKPVTVESLGETMKEGLQHIASRLGGENRSSLTPAQNDPGYRPLHGCPPNSSQPFQGVRKDIHTSTSLPWSTSQSHPRYYSAVKMGQQEEEEEEENERLKKRGLTSQAVQPVKISTSSRNLTLTGMHLHEDLLSSEKESGSRSKASDQLSGGSLDLSERLATVCSPDWSEEVSTVDSYVSDHQSRQTPLKADIQQFVKRCSSLNCHKMLELLTSHLQSSPSIQLRCLFGIEGIIKDDLVSSDVALTLLSSHLGSLQASQDRAVRSKAMKILRQLERLEEDTKLDQPLLSDNRLLSQPSGYDSEMTHESATRDPSSGLHLLDQSMEPGVLEHVDKTSTLFSGMSLVQGSASDNRTSKSTIDSAVPSASVQEAASSKVGLFSSSDLLMDSNPLTEVKSTSKNLLMESNSGENAIGQGTDSSLLTHKGRSEVPSRTEISSVSGATVSEISSMQQLSDDTHRHSHTDPIMSRGAGFSDLLQTLSLSSPTEPGHPVNEQGTAAQQPHLQPSPQHIATTQHPMMKSQDIGRLFPQLSKATLSGASPTPINLAAKPAGAFGFVAGPGDDKQNNSSSSRDTFSFVQDAMKLSKK